MLELLGDILPELGIAALTWSL